MVYVKNIEHEVKIANFGDKVFKEECMVCFNTADYNEGLFVSLKTFFGFCKDHMKIYQDITLYKLFLNIKKNIIRDDNPKTKVKKLAIGMPDGFQINQEDKYEEIYTLVLMPDYKHYLIDSNEISEVIKNSINGIIASEAASFSLSSELNNHEWDGEKRMETKHKLLFQILNPPTVNLSQPYKCDNCDVAENLWLNLSDGTVLCGRKNFDGSGGNDHANEHYKKTKYPLAVKVGTITTQGADVFSYDEDDMVQDPNLTQHLSYFGIDASKLTKTEKTLAELEIELNENYSEWNAIQELSGELKPIFGPGCTGIYNLGNTCYISSVIQTVFNLDSFIQFYYDTYNNYVLEDILNPMESFNMQTSKVAYGLLSGKYSHPPSQQIALSNDLGIKLKYFNMIIKKTHPEFRNNKQQDAHEFFLHLMNQIDRNNHNSSVHGVAPSNSFKFFVQDREQILDTPMVQYQSKLENYLSFVIPMDKLSNKSEYDAYQNSLTHLPIVPLINPKPAFTESSNIPRAEMDESMTNNSTTPDKVFAKIDFKDMFDHYFQPEIVRRRFNLDPLNSGISLDEEEKSVDKTFAFETFPKHLLLHVKKYTFGPGADGYWAPKKLDISIENVPEILDLKPYKGTGLKPDEISINSANFNQSKNDRILAAEEQILFDQALDMGFKSNHVKKGIYALSTQLPVLSIEALLSWCMENQPSSEEGSPIKKQFTVDASHVAAITDMGFTISQAERALSETDNSLERAVDWLFSHPESLSASTTNTDSVMRHFNSSEAESATDSLIERNTTDTRYKLVGIISHMGSSLNCGHYLCHLKKRIATEIVDINGNHIMNGEELPNNTDLPTLEKWVIYNDTKVALSENPPLNFAYMYFYKRLDN